MKSKMEDFKIDTVARCDVIIEKNLIIIDQFILLKIQKY